MARKWYAIFGTYVRYVLQILLKGKSEMCSYVDLAS